MTRRARQRLRWPLLLAAVPLSTCFILGGWIDPNAQFPGSATRIALTQGQLYIFEFERGAVPECILRPLAHPRWKLWVDPYGISPRYGGDLCIPLWIPALLLSAASLWAWRPAHPGPGCCNVCGYSREGLTPAAPCPECGRGLSDRR